MNNFEEIFKLAMTLGEREKLRTLNWLYKKGSKIIKLSKERRVDIKELELTHKQLKTFIKKI